MAAFYTDHNVGAPLVQLLRGSGHDVVTAYDVGLPGAYDEQHLLVAARAGRTLITHNRDDFLLLHRAWQLWSGEWQVRAQHAGVLIIRQTLTFARMAQEIEVVLGFGVPLANRLYDWRPSTGWVSI